MDISKISDINQLKAMAYDRLMIVERTREQAAKIVEANSNDLKLIEQRIAQIEEELATTEKTAQKASKEK